MYDMTFKDVKFKNVADLVDVINTPGSDWYLYVTVYYEGTNHGGTVGINFPRYDFDEEKHTKFIKYATNVLFD